ncbi:hypothetical protein [Patulibacter sp. SYSU D01012]|uniref:hypothetical protein n=1 Tax=Patulibacter sp. SYSU D01012 TaxID=2817381 RepID=UPI001B300644|nr:hypothetical protein [Patulibacter sp. SYSU D01012]
MDADAFRALLAAHPAVAIVPFHGRPGVRCVRVADALRLVRDAGEDADEAAVDALVAALGGTRLLLVDPAGQDDAAVRPAGRGRRRGRERPAPRPRRSGPPLEDLAVYELPARVLGLR